MSEKDKLKIVLDIVEKGLNAIKEIEEEARLYQRVVRERIEEEEGEEAEGDEG